MIPVLWTTGRRAEVVLHAGVSYEVSSPRFVWTGDVRYELIPPFSVSPMLIASRDEGALAGFNED